MTDAILALDLGTSSIKGLLVTSGGILLNQARLAHATHRPAPGAAEQDPKEWWDHACRIITTLTTSAAEPVSIVAISVTGQMHGLVLRDGSGSTIDRAITWQDQRSSNTLASLHDRLPARRRHDVDRTIAPGFLIASWHWVTQTHPDLASRTAQVSLPKDHLIHCLTGHHVTDPSDAVGTGLFDVATGAWDPDLAAAARLPVALLPQIVPAGTSVGEISAEVASILGLSVGTPVVVAGGDAAVGAFGAGVVNPQQELLMLSSGCQLIRPRDELVGATIDGIFTWPSAAPAGLPPFLDVSTLVNGGEAIAWAHRLAPSSSPEAPELLGAGEDNASPHAPIFVPYLGGERSPVNAPVASGAFFGLDHRHTAHHLVESVIEGVTLTLLDRHLAMGGTIGGQDPIRVGGGGTRSRAWLDEIAELFARPLDVMESTSLSGWGAARLAATVPGWIDPIHDPDAWLPPSFRVTPKQSDPDRSRARLQTFRRAASAALALVAS